MRIYSKAVQPSSENSEYFTNKYRISNKYKFPIVGNGLFIALFYTT